MIEVKKENARVYKVERDGREIVELKLVSSSITNKFFIITDFIKRVSEKLGDEFDDWFETFLTEYQKNEEKRFSILVENVPLLKSFVNKFIAQSGVDFSSFVDQSKVKKSSILFLPDEIELITKLSSYLKIYAIISNSENLKIDQRLHKRVYNAVAEDIVGTEVIYKIFNVVKTKTFRYNITDRYMWDYIKMIQCKTIDIHVVEIFNFIMNSILILCEEDKNPITYFVSVVEESVKWFLRSVYKGSVIYEDSVATENIHTLSTNNLKTYSYNDTLGRLKGIAYDYLYRQMEKNTLMNIEEDKPDDSIVKFQNRCYDIKYVSPICECLVFPVLSRITSIPYYHFKTLSPEHSAVLSCYLHFMMKKVFKTDYKNLFALLDYYPTNPPALTTTYKIKLIHDYINMQNSVQDFYGFNTKKLPHRVLSYLVGRISRVNFCNVFDGEKLAGVPLSKIESDMIKFYTLFFSGGLDEELKKLAKTVNIDF